MITVTTPAKDANLVDLAVVRELLSIDGNDEDKALEGFIARASDVISRHCRRTFGKETVEETFRPDQCLGELILSRYPVVSIASISENGTTLSADDYEVDKDRGFVTRLHGTRPCYWSTCKTIVTYVAGYDLPASTPQALQQACLQLVKAFYLGADRDPLIRSESVTPMSSASYFGGSDYLPPDVIGLLGQFRNLRMR
ncbi:MAG: phage head-tail connector protein [Hyphomicrobiaceae bacterium]